MGQFNDNTGDFEFNKDPNETGDNWLHDTNWKKVANMDENVKSKYDEKYLNDHMAFNSENKITFTTTDVIENIEKIMKFLLPHENVSMGVCERD